MKKGVITLVGLAIWLTSKFLLSNYYVHLYDIASIGALIALVGGILWLSKKDNSDLVAQLLGKPSMTELFKIFNSGRFVIFFIGILIIAAFFSQSLSISIKNSTAFEELKKTISSHEGLIEMVGPVKLISLGNSYSYGREGNRTTLTAKAIVFGEKGETSLKTKTVYENGIWTVELEE